MAINALIAGGGIGAKVICTEAMMDDMNSFYYGGKNKSIDLYLSYKDEAGSDRITFERMTKINTELKGYDRSSRLFKPSGRRVLIDITADICSKTGRTNQSLLSIENLCQNSKFKMDLDNLDLFLSSFEESTDTTFGYLQEPALASVFSAATSAYKEIIDGWVDAMLDGEQLSLCVVIPLQGAEGIGTGIAVLSVLRSTIHDKCMEKGMTLEQEKKLIAEKRRVLVLAIAGYRPPAGSSTILATDYKKRCIQILASVSEISNDRADGLIYVSSDDPIVISGKDHAIGGDQEYHNSLICLQAAKAVDNWMNKRFNSASLRNENGLNILVDPIDKLGQGKVLSYNDLALPKGYKEMIASHLSFAASVLLGIRPMINGGDVRYQPLFRNVFGSKEMNSLSDIGLGEKIINPITCMSELLYVHLVMFQEISCTGTDWIKKTDQGKVQYNYDLVSLFDGPSVADVLSKADANAGTDVDYDLKKLTAYNDGEKRNVRTESVYLGKLISKVIDESNTRKGFLPIRHSDPSKDIFKAFRSLYDALRLDSNTKGENHEN